MSENYRYYAEKVAEAQATRAIDHPLQSEIEELFSVVRECEAMWALEDRIERG
jgi:hypothetical protein